MIRVVAAYAGLGAGCAYLLSRPGHQAYDIDTAHTRWEQIQQRNEQLSLPSEYAVHAPDDLRYRFNFAKVGFLDDHAIRLDEQTRKWIVKEGSAQSLAQAASLTALSVTRKRSEAQALLDFPAAHLLSAEQWSTLLSPYARRCRALDVGAGAGHITRCFAPLFKEVYAVEVADALVFQLSQKGFNAAKTQLASPSTLRSLGLPSTFDAVFALNVLDRVPRADAFLANLVALTAPGGLLVIALPLPLCSKPWDAEADTTATSPSPNDHGLAPAARDSAWAQRHALSLPSHSTGSDAAAVDGVRGWEHAARAVAARLSEEGLSVQRVARAPYLCQRSFSLLGLFGFSPPPLVLDGAVFLAQKPPAQAGEGQAGR